MTNLATPKFRPGVLGSYNAVTSFAIHAFRYNSTEIYSALSQKQKQKSNIRLSTNWRRKPFSIDPDSEIEKTIIKLQICANYGKILLIKAPQTYFSHLLSNTLLFIY